MVTVIGVRFRRAGKIYYFSPNEYDIKVNDNVIVEKPTYAGALSVFKFRRANVFEIPVEEDGKNYH